MIKKQRPSTISSVLACFRNGLFAAILFGTKTHLQTVRAVKRKQ